MKYYFTSINIFCFAFFFQISLFSQDIIIKNDKVEVKSRVEEITDTHIKYKKWENLSGPIYNIRKTEVFMILYANGQREIINQNEVLQPNSLTTSEPFRQQEYGKKDADDGVATKSVPNPEKVNYRPVRFIFGAQSPLEFGIDTELRLIPNFMNIGITYIYGFPDIEDVTGTEFGSIYVSAYLPVNRLAKNYQNQNKGLFFFGNVGLSVKSTSIYNSKTFKSDKYYSDFYATYRLGADYYFSQKFGLSFSTISFNMFYVGISSKF